MKVEIRKGKKLTVIVEDELLKLASLELGQTVTFNEYHGDTSITVIDSDKCKWYVDPAAVIPKINPKTIS